MIKFIGLLLIAVITGCSWTPEFAYYHPYGNAVCPADLYVEQVLKTSRVNMGLLCGDDAAGACVYGAGVGSYYIYISEELSEEKNREAYEHELGHVYEQEVLGVARTDSFNHEGWLVNPNVGAQRRD